MKKNESTLIFSSLALKVFSSWSVAAKKSLPPRPFFSVIFPPRNAPKRRLAGLALVRTRRSALPLTGWNVSTKSPRGGIVVLGGRCGGRRRVFVVEFSFFLLHLRESGTARRRRRSEKESRCPFLLLSLARQGSSKRPILRELQGMNVLRLMTLISCFPRYSITKKNDRVRTSMSNSRRRRRHRRRRRRGSSFQPRPRLPPLAPRRALQAPDATGEPAYASRASIATKGSAFREPAPRPPFRLPRLLLCPRLRRLRTERRRRQRRSARRLRRPLPLLLEA